LDRASSELVRDSPSDLSLIKKISLSEPGKNRSCVLGGEDVVGEVKGEIVYGRESFIFDGAVIY